MELSRQEYPALLSSIQPSQAVSVLGDRIRIINKVNADIADWLQERRRVEEAYAQGLRKLAHRPQLDNDAALGVFQLPWQRILNATEILAVAHETLAQKIEQDVERPLREYSSKHRDLQSMSGIQSDLAVLVKNLEASQKKVDKAKDKGGSKGAEKLASAVNAMAETTQQWESRAPFVFEQLQAIDESRVNHLRDVLTQLETHEVDQVERCRQAAEACLNVLLNVKTEDEIQTFAAKINGGRPVVPRQSDASSSAPGASLAPPPSAPDDAASQRSGRSGNVRTPPAPEPQPRHTPLGGLKRLGTVMNRRKSVVGMPGHVEKKGRSPFSSFKRSDSSGTSQTPPATGSDRPGTAVTSTESQTDAIRRLSELREHEATNAVENSHAAAGTTNGTIAHGLDATTNMTERPNELRVDSEGYTEKPDTMDAITRAQLEAASTEEPALNLTIRDQPIFEDESQAKQAMDEMANTLRLQAQQTGIRRNAGTIRGRRDVRNTVFIPTPQTPGQELSGLYTSSTPTTPAKQSRHVPSPSVVTDDHTLSDTTSIRSSHTLHSMSGPVSHPELHEPGLNASIIETVSAWFSDGAVTKSFVVGELALAYNSGHETPLRDVRVRLDNFQLLEKVAANPNFVKEQADEDKKGEYDVQLTSISRPLPTVAFKYQVHINPSNASAYCPVVFQPIWNLEQSQASAIIQYSVNPSFVSKDESGTITLKNVVLTVNLDTTPEEDPAKQSREVAHATAAVMYPNTGAKFRRKQSAVVWKMPELEVQSDTPGKFLVRFSTTGGWPHKGKVDAKFELHTTGTGTTRLGISAASDRSAPSSKESDPFADEDAAQSSSAAAAGAAAPTVTDWQEIPTIRKLAAGKYVST